MTVYVGIDGGGTKTEALFVNTQTKQQVRKSGPASRPTSIGWDVSRQVLVDLIEQGVAGMQATMDDVASISVCMSGIDLPEQSYRMEQELKGVFTSASIEVVNDALAVLAAGTQGKTGVVLIAGTGSIAMGEDVHGLVARAGGYGSLLGDEGSGFDIGRQGLMAAIQAFEGRGPKTVLWERAAEMYQITHPRQLLSSIYESEVSVARIAAFTPHVVENAQLDEASRCIVQDAVQSYMKLIRSVRQQLQAQVSDLVILSGGLLSSGGTLVDALRKAIYPLTVHPLENSPVEGALTRARTLPGRRGLA